MLEVCGLWTHLSAQNQNENNRKEKRKAGEEGKGGRYHSAIAEFVSATLLTEVIQGNEEVPC